MNFSSSAVSGSSLQWPSSSSFINSVFTGVRTETSHSKLNPQAVSIWNSTSSSFLKFFEATLPETESTACDQVKIRQRWEGTYAWDISLSAWQHARGSRLHSSRKSRLPLTSQSSGMVFGQAQQLLQTAQFFFKWQIPGKTRIAMHNALDVANHVWKFQLNWNAEKRLFGLEYPVPSQNPVPWQGILNRTASWWQVCSIQDECQFVSGVSRPSTANFYHLIWTHNNSPREHTAPCS